VVSQPWAFIACCRIAQPAIERQLSLLDRNEKERTVKKLLLALGVAIMAASHSYADKNPVVVMETSLGTIKIELDEQKAPITVKNFLSYVDDKFYDGTIFHRVIRDFMVQGGGFEPGLKQKRTKAPIKNESGNGLSNARGSIAMARTNDLNSATAQFFINVVDNSRLDPARYCVFGKVIDGMDVVDKIRDVSTTRKADFADVPQEDVVIKSTRRASN
jgi:cyclophilin family peptidyl-prolyl cis-trans isomerase